MSNTGALALAQVMAHCGGSPVAAAGFIGQAIAADPADPRPYAALNDLRRALPADVASLIARPATAGAMLARAYVSFLDGSMDDAAVALGAVAGHRPDVPWAAAPWFNDERFRTTVTAAAVGEAAVRISYGAGLDAEAVRGCVEPWLVLMETVCARQSDAEAMARMGILLRACGLPDASFAWCDRADAVRPVMLTEVVRAGTWRRLGNRAETAAAFRRALALDPDNWSLYLDLADLAAEEGDFAEAATLASRGEELEPNDVTMRAAAAAYRGRATGSAADLEILAALAPQVDQPYRQQLLDYSLRP